MPLYRSVLNLYQSTKCLACFQGHPPSLEENLLPSIHLIVIP